MPTGTASPRVPPGSRCLKRCPIGTSSSRRTAELAAADQVLTCGERVFQGPRRPAIDQRFAKPKASDSVALHQDNRLPGSENPLSRETGWERDCHGLFLPWRELAVGTRSPRSHYGLVAFCEDPARNRLTVTLTPVSSRLLLRDHFFVCVCAAHFYQSGDTSASPMSSSCPCLLDNPPRCDLVRRGTEIATWPFSALMALLASDTDR